MPRWSLTTRIAFRFCFAYFTLYVVSTQMLGGLILVQGFDVPDLGSTGVMQRIVTWAGTHAFHISYPYSFAITGSGDKTVDYLQAFCLLVISVAVTAVWSALDRRRTHYRGLNKWFRVFLRFSLGSTMISYGMVKAMPMQMSAPGLTRLLEPFGNFSPMGVLWASIGASTGYEMFAGFMELAGGILLFIPWLATLGAVVTFANAVQIFTLNMTYDVPVKLFSFHLILMSLVLVAPEAARIADVLVLNRTAGPSTQPPLFSGRRAVIVAVVVQLVFGAYLVGMNYRTARQSWTQRLAGASKSPLYGIWNIETMKIDGHTRSPLVTDYARWRRVIFQGLTNVSFQRMDDTFAGYGAKVDMKDRTLTITTGGKDGPSSRFAIQQPDAEHLILDGEMDGHKIRMEARLFDRNNFLLISRGPQFNWIQERPFNR
jgi:uncharacterized membrane protein YphA (DoxX/SURF4 family)